MVDLGSPRRVHIIGIGGSGMSAISEVLVGMGHRVTGSDAADSVVLDRLRRLGVVAWAGHDAAHVDDVDAVAVSTAIPRENPEVVAARQAGIPVLRRAELLAAICGQKRTIAVAGTHGKTTTSALLATILVETGRNPAFVVGGELTALGTSGRWGSGEWMVVEADESDGTFLQLPAEIAVVTSVEPDHLDYWGDFAQLVAAFERFIVAAAMVAICGDDRTVAEIAGRHQIPSYGFDPANAFRIEAFEGGRDGCRFRVAGHPVELPLPGRHNALNATAAVLAATWAGVPADQAAGALARFGGVGRRFHRRGERDGVTYVDEYAHLPAEVAASIAAAREGGWRRVVAVFQPHRYTRTAALWRDFATAFDGADVLALTDVYPAGQQPMPGVTGKLIVDAVLEANPSRRVAWMPDRAGLVTFLRRELRPGDLCLTLGAGDLTTLPDELLK